MVAGVLLRSLLHLSAGKVVDGQGMATFHAAAWAAVPVGALVGGAVARNVGVADLVAWTAPASVLAALTVVAIRTASTDATNRLTPSRPPWSDALVLGSDQPEGV
jgi:predicted MFS family arabinose efflux permease